MAQPLVSYIYFTAVCLGSVASCAPLFRRAAATGEFELSPPVALQWCWTVARVTFGIMPLGNYSMVAYLLTDAEAVRKPAREQPLRSYWARRETASPASTVHFTVKSI